MALNFKTLGTRSLSAVFFVLILLGCLLWNYYSFTIFFFAVSMIGLNEFYNIAEKMDAKPFRIIGFICALVLYVVFVDESINPLSCFQKPAGAFIVLLPFLIFAGGMFSKETNSIRSSLFTIGGIIYSVLPFALLNQTAFYDDGCNDATYTPWLILGIIFLIWSNDTFAYLGGSLFGKHKMIERVSPGKTWEGTLIGILLTFALSFTFNIWVYRLDPVIWPVLGIFIPVLATIGDLVESKLKREAGIKDSGTIMPGHGGVLDRFDSLIFVSPFVFVLFRL
jgi:phosphatidate cytidylyltransferase